MNADEIVRALRCFSNCSDTKCHDCQAYEKYCEDHSWKDDYYVITADLIESLQAQLATAVKQIEKLMAASTIAGNERCDICSKATSIPCEECVPSWQSPKGAREND